VGGAQVTLLDDSANELAHSETDASGRVSFALAATPRLYHLLVRRLGYRPTERTISVDATHDTVVVQVVLGWLASVLDTVRVSASLTAKQRAYHIDSTAIAQSARVLFDAWDIVTKLRPDIASGRGFCAGVQDVWVDGRWIPPELVVPNEMAIARLGPRTDVTPHLNARRGRTPVRDIVVSILSSIKPQDIAEMTFRDCTDDPLPQRHTESALFIVLKPGVAFDPVKGSYRP
jgi:hypothetical protein